MNMTFVPGALAFVVPFLGPLIALTSPLFAARYQPRVWPDSRRRTAVLAGLAMVVGIWLLLILVPSGIFLLLPLCGPESVLGWFLPSALAVAAYGLVSFMSVRRKNPWMWPLAAVAGAVTFSLSSFALTTVGIRFVC